MMKSTKLFTALMLVLGTVSTFAAQTNGPIAMLTYIKIKPGTESQFMDAFNKIIEPSRAEPGNLAWLVQKSDEDPSTIVFYTRWKNEEALRIHLASAPLVEYIAKTRALLEPGYPKFVRFQPIDIPSTPLDVAVKYMADKKKMTIQQIKSKYDITSIYEGWYEDDQGVDFFFRGNHEFCRVKMGSVSLEIREYYCT